MKKAQDDGLSLVTGFGVLFSFLSVVAHWAKDRKDGKDGNSSQSLAGGRGQARGRGGIGDDR